MLSSVAGEEEKCCMVAENVFWLRWETLNEFGEAFNQVPRSNNKPCWDVGLITVISTLAVGLAKNEAACLNSIPAQNREPLEPEPPKSLSGSPALMRTEKLWVPMDAELQVWSDEKRPRTRKKPVALAGCETFVVSICTCTVPVSLAKITLSKSAGVTVICALVSNASSPSTKKARSELFSTKNSCILLSLRFISTVWETRSMSEQTPEPEPESESPFEICTENGGARTWFSPQDKLSKCPRSKTRALAFCGSFTELAFTRKPINALSPGSISESKLRSSM